MLYEQRAHRIHLTGVDGSDPAVNLGQEEGPLNKSAIRVKNLHMDRRYACALISLDSGFHTRSKIDAL